ncbi:MAG: serine/threonine-protein kinase [Elainellaceae cyanobacterium]
MLTPLGSELKRSKYRLLGLVGQGQFGRVFCAVHRQTGKLVALKDLDRQRFPTHKFLRELRFLLSLQHPNIVTCQALEHSATGRYLVMDYCEGGTLRNLMSDAHHLRLSQSLKLIADILAGLEHAHQRGIVHCDIKPENILLNVEPNGWTARISDFGIARLSQEISDRDLGNTGSPAYMAPERFYGQYSPTSDIYSVGILLFELLVGYRPFSGTPADLMSAHLNSPVKLPDAIPEIWRPILIKALQKLSARRFRSAGEMLTTLKAVAQAESGLWLDTQIDKAPLLRAAAPSPLAPLDSYQPELLRSPLDHLAVQESMQQEEALLYIYRAKANQAAFQIQEQKYQTEQNSSSLKLWHREIWHVPPYGATIQALLPRPQGCFVVTQRSLHLIPIGTETSPQLASQLILDCEQKDLIAIEANGRWIARFQASSTGGGSTFTLQSLLGLGAKVTRASKTVSIMLHPALAQPQQLLALDNRHVALLIGVNHLPLAQRNQTKISGNSTLIKILTRRGKEIGSLHLPIQIDRAVLTPTPYQVLAIDRSNPTSVLLIDLKPYRILRLGVDLEPEFLITTLWGYIFANSDGLITFVDREGQQIGRMQAPARITAMTMLQPHELLVATWEGQQGYLHRVDLKTATLDLLF